MVRFNDKTAITTAQISADDIIPITDLSASSDDKKISMGQIGEFVSNNSNIAHKNLDNTGMISDAILKAPNGVFVAGTDADTLVVKSGLEVLVPNGRNDDKTLKSTSYTLENDLTQSTTTIADGTYSLFINSSGAVAYVNNTNMFVSRTEPEIPSTINDAYWYDIQTNYWKRTTNQGSTWTNQPICQLGFFTIQDGLVISIVPNTLIYIPNSEYILVRDLSNITDGGKRVIAKEALGYVPMIELASSGTVQLTDNSMHYIEPTGTVIFTLPTITDNTVFHQLLVQLNMSTVQTISVGTTYFFDKTTPDLSNAGEYNIVYEYDGSHWVCGVISKGTAE